MLIQQVNNTLTEESASLSCIQKKNGRTQWHSTYDRAHDSPKTSRTPKLVLEEPALLIGCYNKLPINKSCRWTKTKLEHQVAFRAIAGLLQVYLHNRDLNFTFSRCCVCLPIIWYIFELAKVSTNSCPTVKIDQVIHEDNASRKKERNLNISLTYITYWYRYFEHLSEEHGDHLHENQMRQI